MNTEVLKNNNREYETYWASPQKGDRVGLKPPSIVKMLVKEIILLSDKGGGVDHCFSLKK